MPDNKAKKLITEMFDNAGITVNGKQPYDIQIQNEGVYSAVLGHGNLGAGESFMEEWWDVEDLATMVFMLMRSGGYKNLIRTSNLWTFLKARLFNQQTKDLSKRVAEQHYDLGNILYEKMLDPRMQYTCAYWKNAKNLNEAQEHKLDLICRKIHLKSSDKVLELGCGWGGFAKFAAEKYGCQVTAYNISKEQIAWAREKAKGLPIEFRLQDYREALGEYDKVVAIGLCEHIGYKNYRNFFQLIRDRLKDSGLALVHTIGNNMSRYATDPWLDKYIFPGSLIPSPTHLSRSFNKILVLEDWHNFGPDYDKTLMAWWENFNNNWDSLKSDNYNKQFYRMWKYYLQICAGAFRGRWNQLWQIVLSKSGLVGGYESIR